MHMFTIIRYISIVDYFLVFKYRGRVFSEPFMKRLLCFDFKQTEITKRSSGSTEHLPKRRNQLLQHQMETNCKRNSLSINKHL
jgi:hypothetical protein